mgnify:CR=1 FL=1
MWMAARPVPWTAQSTRNPNATREARRRHTRVFGCGVVVEGSWACGEVMGGQGSPQGGPWLARGWPMGGPWMANG